MTLYFFIALIAVAIIATINWKFIQRKTWEETLKLHGKWAVKILSGHLHLELIFMIGKKIQTVQFGSKDAKDLVNHYIIALATTSLVIVLGGTAIVGWIANNFIVLENNTFVLDGVQYNAIILLLFALTVIVPIVVLEYWLIWVLIFGWKSIKPGYIGLKFINKRPVYVVSPLDAAFLTFPGLNFVSHWQERSEVIIRFMVTQDGPKILTSSALSASYELDEMDRMRECDDISERARLSGDPLHENRKFINYFEVELVLSLDDPLKFYEKRISMEEAVARLEKMLMSASWQSLGKKTGAQSALSIDVIKNRVNEVMVKFVENYDNCFKVKTIAPSGPGLEDAPINWVAKKETAEVKVTVVAEGKKAVKAA